MLDSTDTRSRPDDLASLILANPARYALFVDFDGTLADIATTPDQVRVEPRLPQDIIHVQDMLGGAMALITGRRIADANRHLAPALLPGSGLHGLEFSAGPLARGPGEAGLPEALGAGLPQALFQQVVALTRPMAGVALENKGPIVSVHYRQAPQHESELNIGLTRLLTQGSFDYHIKHGRAVLELIPNGTSKGTALMELMRHEPFAGRRPIMIGDDKADEDAFAVARAAGGFGLTVRGEHFRSGDESFGSAGEVRRWLAALADARQI